MKDPKSKCCNADMTVHEADEGTNFYVCVKCQKPTDSRPEIIVTACTCASFFTVRGKHKPDCPKQMNKKKNHKTCKKENCNRAPYILSGEFCERHCTVCTYCQYEPENGHALTCEFYKEAKVPVQVTHKEMTKILKNLNKPICGYCKKNIGKTTYVRAGSVVKRKRTKAPHHMKCFLEVLNKAYESTKKN